MEKQFYVGRTFSVYPNGTYFEIKALWHFLCGLKLAEACGVGKLLLLLSLTLSLAFPMFFPHGKSVVMNVARLFRLPFSRSRPFPFSCSFDCRNLKWIVLQWLLSNVFRAIWVNVRELLDGTKGNDEKLEKFEDYWIIKIWLLGRFRCLLEFIYVVTDVFGKRLAKFDEKVEELMSFEVSKNLFSSKLRRISRMQENLNDL